jgi:hypothetical protein
LDEHGVLGMAEAPPFTGGWRSGTRRRSARYPRRLITLWLLDFRRDAVVGPHDFAAHFAAFERDSRAHPGAEVQRLFSVGCCDDR